MACLPYRILLGISLLALAACTQPVATSSRLTNEQKQSLAMANTLKQAGSLDEAIRIYTDILLTVPDANEAAVELASLYRKTGEPEKALALMRTAQLYKADDPAVLTQMGYALVDLGQPEEAVNVFDQLMAISHNNAAAYNGKGVAFDSAGNHLVAQELYQHALKLSPGAVHIQNNLGMSMIVNGQVDDAIALLEPLYEQHRENKTIRQNLALAYGLKGDSKKALAFNLIDLPEKEAKENLKSYKQYALEQKKQKKEKPLPLPLHYQASAPAKSPAASPAPAIGDAKTTKQPETVKKEASPQEAKAKSSNPPKAASQTDSKPQPKAPESKQAANKQGSDATDVSIADEQSLQKKLDTLAASQKPEDASPSSGPSADTEKPKPARKKSPYPTKHGDWSVDRF